MIILNFLNNLNDIGEKIKNIEFNNLYDDFIIGKDLCREKCEALLALAVCFINAKDKSSYKEIYLPNSILLLNFNYTRTADLYLPNEEIFKVNHIHGDLSDKCNIIFGYGDELDDNYKNILKQDNNEYLKNIKSINYLNSTNYREMLSYIESSPYQIYIMGHSCGLSDKTLLNTLFEHDNCVSIKPFYYINNEGFDNYTEIVQNISRNFTDMKLMRDRVVNKTFCETLE